MFDDEVHQKDNLKILYFKLSKEACETIKKRKGQLSPFLFL